MVSRKTVFLVGAGQLALLLLIVPFAYYSAVLGLRGLSLDLSGQSRFYDAARPFPTLGIFAHMLAGAVISALAPLQLFAPLRSRLPVVHRWSGYLLVSSAVIAASGGLVFILLQGTIGGPMMDIGFSIYGLGVLVTAAATFRHGHARRLDLHRRWALRLFWLAIASWLYRVHYALWVLATGGAGMAPDFTGWFDRLQNFAFFLPYLLGVELYFHLRDRRAKPV